MSEAFANAARRNDRTAPMASLHIEVIADLICPFCFIGKRRFDEALKAVQGPSEVSWHPYRLNPDMPAAGLGFDEYLTRKFGNPDNVKPALEYLRLEGEGARIAFRFDRIRRVPSTLVIHQLMQFAQTLGKDQSALADDLLSAFFEHGINIGERGALIDLASQHGISAPEVGDAIGSDSFREIVLSAENQVRSSGLASVPGFLVNRRLLVVGAQETDKIVNAFDRAMFGEDTDALVSPALH